MVSQVAAATDRKQLRPGKPDEGAEDAQDDDGERGHVAAGTARSRLPQDRHGPAAEGGEQNRYRRDPDAETIEEV